MYTAVNGIREQVNEPRTSRHNRTLPNPPEIRWNQTVKEIIANFLGNTKLGHSSIQHVQMVEKINR